MAMKYVRHLVFSLLFFTSCRNSGEKQIVGPYYIATDPAGPYKTLYYSLPSGLMAERIQNVDMVGYTADFVFVKSADKFYCINRTQDRAADSGDSVVQKAISQPLTATAFAVVLDSLGLVDFTFQYAAI